jgi:hypothetical protein
VVCHPGHGRVAHHAHAQCIGDQDGRLEDPAFLDPVRARHIAVAVAGEEAGEHARAVLLAAGQNGGYAGSHRADADHCPSSRAGDEGLVSDLDAGHIGDGVVGTGGAVERDAEVPGAWLLFRLGGCGPMVEAGDAGHARGGELEAGASHGTNLVSFLRKGKFPRRRFFSHLRSQAASEGLTSSYTLAPDIGRD